MEGYHQMSDYVTMTMSLERHMNAHTLKSKPQTLVSFSFTRNKTKLAIRKLNPNTTNEAMENPLLLF